jgi:hypothetical protein
MPVVVVIYPVSHRLNMPPTATVNAIRRTVAIMGLIALDMNTLIYYLSRPV